MEETYSREESNILDFREFEREKRHKPSQDVLIQLKYIKQRRLNAKKLFYPCETIEADIGFLLSQDSRGKNRIELIKLIIFKLQELQIQKHIIDFSRAFLRNLFKEYSNINNRTIQRRMEELLIYAKVRERIKIDKVLEKTGIKNCQELIYRDVNRVFQSYSFI